jgi:4-hydroxymandelate oxidase
VSVPGGAGPARGPRLVRAERRTFAGSADYLRDPGNRTAVGSYLSDLVQAYPGDGLQSPVEVSPEQGQSYGEMAEPLIGALVAADQPVGLLVLAYSIHDLQPGRATATYLSSVCPGTPVSFAISDQGSAAAYSALRIVRDYPAGGSTRSLVIVLEQAALPYGDGTGLPAQHRGVALLFEDGPVENGPVENGPVENRHSENGIVGGTKPGTARLAALVQRPSLAATAVAGQAAADLAELAAGYPEVRLVLSRALAAEWPEHPGDAVGPADQPATGVWWQLLDELATGRPGLLVAADYDPELGYLCLAAFELS